MSKDQFDLIIDTKELKATDRQYLGELAVIPYADSFTGIPEIKELWERLQQPTPLSQEEREQLAIKLYKSFTTIIWHKESMTLKPPIVEDIDKDLNKIKETLKSMVARKDKDVIITEIPALIMALLNNEDLNPIFTNMKELVRKQFVKDFVRSNLVIKDNNKEYRIFGYDLSIMITEGNMVSFTKLVTEGSDNTDSKITSALRYHLANINPHLKEELSYNDIDVKDGKVKLADKEFNIVPDIAVNKGDSNEKIDILAGFLKDKFQISDQDINCLIDLANQSSLWFYSTAIVPTWRYNQQHGLNPDEPNSDPTNYIDYTKGKGDTVINIKEHAIDSIVHYSKHIKRKIPDENFSSEISRLETEIKFATPKEQRNQNCGLNLPPFIHDLNCILRYKAVTDEGKINCNFLSENDFVILEPRETPIPSTTVPKANIIESGLQYIRPYGKHIGIGAAGTVMVAFIGVPSTAAAAAGIVLYKTARWAYNKKLNPEPYQVPSSNDNTFWVTRISQSNNQEKGLQ